MKLCSDSALRSICFPPGCAEQFYARTLVSRIARMTLMNAGTLVLIPGPVEQRASSDKELENRCLLVRTDPDGFRVTTRAQDLSAIR